MTNESFSILKKLLQIERNMQKQDKDILKNYGSWIGLITLARSKPITNKQLDIKHMLIDAYPTQQRLSTVLPLVCKILENSKDSFIFKDYNPWIRTILSILDEINRD